MAIIGEYSEVAIYNLALQEIGRGMRVTATDENTNAARTLTARYPYARDATLRAYDWNFATSRASLAANAVAPVYEFAFAYDLPADPFCLRVRNVFGANMTDWRVEGRQILTSFGSPIQIKYTSRVTSVGLMDPLFIATLACRLAAECAVTLAESSEKASNLWQVYTSKLREARGVDAQEGQADQLPDGSWADSRIMGSGYIPPYSDWNPNA